MKVEDCPRVVEGLRLLVAGSLGQAPVAEFDNLFADGVNVAPLSRQVGRGSVLHLLISAFGATLRPEMWTMLVRVAPTPPTLFRAPATSAARKNLR